MIIPANRTIGRIPHLRAFLADHPRAVAGWGRKSSGRIAEWLARILGRPFVLLEDGFLRSVARRGAPASLMVDDIGIYYDAGRPSRMETLIATGVNAEEAKRAAALAARWRAARVSKYNHAPEYDGELPARYVLVVDQTAGDLSLRLGGAGQDSFRAMLAAALNENPEHHVVVKVHPDLHTHAKRGHFTTADLDHPRVRTIATECHPVRLIEGATTVYAVTSLMGFEALLWSKKVRCVGMPFYAGWGLTDDELAAPARRGKASFEAVVHAALVGCPRYVDSATGQRVTAEHAIDHVAAGRAALLASSR